MSQKFQTIRERMTDILTADFSPLTLDIIDDSDRHIGHAGHNGQGESHFKVELVSKRFEGLNRVERHKLVYEALKDLIPPVHALQIKADTPV